MTRKPVTDAELSALCDRALDLIVDLNHADDRIKKNIGYAEDVKQPAGYAKTIAGLAAAAAGLANAMLIPLAHEEDRAAIMAKLKARDERP
jgi:hypothetical protein